MKVSVGKQSIILSFSRESLIVITTKAAKHSRQEFMQFLLTMFSSCEELDTLEISLLYEKYYDMK